MNLCFNLKNDIKKALDDLQGFSMKFDWFLVCVLQVQIRHRHQLAFNKKFDGVDTFLELVALALNEHRYVNIVIVVVDDRMICILRFSLRIFNRKDSFREIVYGRLMIARISNISYSFRGY